MNGMRFEPRVLFLLGGAATGLLACSSDLAQVLESPAEVAGPAIDTPAPETSPDPATCTNRAQDGDESDVDCGGGCPTKCGAGKECADTSDCLIELSCNDGSCLAKTSANGKKDGTETDVDCGGVAAPRCADSEACSSSTDCVSGVCTGGVCQVPSPTDGVKNGTETDIDCGGSGSTPRCAIDAACVAPTDCFQSFCVDAVCAEPPSCRAGGMGTTTCGAMGVESCCTTLDVPGGPFNQINNGSYAVTVSAFKLDKYEITQGRLRAFYAAFGGNLRKNPPAAGAGANPRVPNSGWQSVWNDRLPEDMSQVDDRLTTGDGCYGADDAHTWTTTTGANDAKAVNCVDWYTLAAFCIWDGGRLPTEAEWGFAAEGGDQQNNFAWGNWPNASGTIPVGSDPNTYLNQIGKWVVHAFCNSEGPSCFSYGTPYRLNGDGAAHIAPPGQKFDVARWGHHDMSGNLIEWTLDNADGSNPCTGADCARVNWPNYAVDRKDPANKTILGDRSVGGLPSYWRNYSLADTSTLNGDARYHLDGGRVMRGGSWELAHPVSVRSRYGSYPIWRAYYAAGGRCARD